MLLNLFNLWIFYIVIEVGGTHISLLVCNFPNFIFVLETYFKGYNLKISNEHMHP